MMLSIQKTFLKKFPQTVRSTDQQGVWEVPMGPAHNHIILATLIDWDDCESYEGASQNLLVLNFAGT